MMTLALRNWWVLVLRGAFGILFGLAALTFPWQVITTLVLLFGAYALVDGVVALGYALRVSPRDRVWTLLLEGALGILIGVVSLIWPHLTARALLSLIGVWAVMTGILEIAAMSWLRRLGLSGLLLAVSGVLSIVLGVALFFMPEAGLVVLTGLLGGYALGFGVLLCWLGVHFRRLELRRDDRDSSASSKLRPQMAS
jgi:uncharacterized membrane protein HdeD (DUF308 family)